jgi:hypothetical protein
MGVVSTIIDYISVIIAPFLAHPIIMYVIALLLIGTDAYYSSIPQTSNMLLDYCKTQAQINSTVFGLPFIGDALKVVINSLFNPTNIGFAQPSNVTFQTCIDASQANSGIFGSALTGILRLLGMPQGWSISSFELFFVMLFTTILGTMAWSILIKQ